MSEQIRQLFIKHISLETSEQEAIRVRELLKNEQLRKEFDSLQKSWEDSLLLHGSFSSEKGLVILKKKIKRREFTRISFIRIVAIFVGLLAIGSLLIFDYQSVETIVADNQIMNITLPDSSTVVLNKKSAISFRKSKIWNFDRKVSLQGEAFFDVKKRNGKRFEVRCNELNVEVFGTQFNVRYISSGCEVALKEGLVKLANSDVEDDVFMTPGDYVVFNQENHTLDLRKVNVDLYDAWKEQAISFNDFTFEEVATIISNIYGYTVSYDKAVLGQRRFSGSAPTDDLDILLKAMSKILNREIQIQNEEIIIK